MSIRQALFEKMVKEAGWQPSDGDYPGHWRAYPPGSRTLWSCNWILEHGIVTADELEPSWLRVAPIRVIDGQVVVVEVGVKSPHELRLEDEQARAKRLAGITVNGEDAASIAFVWPWTSSRPEGLQFDLFRPGWPLPRWYVPRV